MNKRKARPQDLSAMLELYPYLKAQPPSQIDDRVRAIWEEILSDENRHVLLIEVEGRPVSTCDLLIVPTLTRGGRPYAVVEYVVTHPDYRKSGYGKAVLDYAKEIAESANCYKLMLMTGAKDEATLRFYENAGYNKNDKTGFIQWINL